MSEENVEIVREMVTALLKGDSEGALAPIDRAIEWDISAHPLPDWPNTGRGREEFATHLATYLGGWRHYEGEIRELIDSGDDVILVLHETVGLRDSDAILDRDLHQIFTVRDGKIVYCRVFKTKGEALEATGLSE